MAKRDKPLVRPLSPYWQYVGVRTVHTMGFSILHRFTGVALSVGLIALSFWLIAASSGPVSYAHAQALFATSWMKIALAGWTFSFCYHLLNGIRHLVWDAGRAFDLKVARNSGYLVFAAAVLLTLFVLALFFSRTGGAV